MDAITVCVDYADILAITLPRNRGLFGRYVIVTSESDIETMTLAQLWDCELVTTDVFYDRGASFNKGAGMEQGLRLMANSAWTCILDADIVLPKRMDYVYESESCIYGPYRYGCPLEDGLKWASKPSDAWTKLSLMDDREIAGYCQIFEMQYALDLMRERGRDSLYGVDWSHAGGCDSEFLLMWDRDRWRRVPWRVLHIGEDAKNWCGRVSGVPVTPSVLERMGARERLFNDRGRWDKLPAKPE